MTPANRFEFTEAPSSADEIIKIHSRSFYLASLLLPSKVRGDVRKLYAWCRWCDDAIDKSPTRDIGRERLAALRVDVERIEHGDEPLQSCSRWLAQVRREHAIPSTLCHDLLDGMEMDSRGATIRNDSDLALYCYRAAGSVGLMMSRLLGVKDARAGEHARSLGIAMQLTNIARDVGEDLRMGRCYIPDAWRDPFHPSLSRDALRAHVARLLSLADEYYEKGFAGLQYLPRTVRFSIRTAAHLYRAIGEEIRRNKFDTVTKRGFVPWQRKLTILLSCMFQELGCFLRPSPQNASALRNLHSFLTPRDLEMNGEARYLVCLGLSLTLIMATALFALIGINPKDSSYQALPWVYSGISALCSVALGLLAKRFQEEMDQEIAAEPLPVANESARSRR